VSDSFTSNLANHPISAHCPGCDGPVEVTEADALAGQAIVCPGCNRQIQLKADESLQESVNDVDRAMTDLRRSIDNFGR
jgi:uncharacterized paraquat-inducible protein A